MPQYRVHRLKEGQRESFRWAAHTGGLAIAKLKDYESAEEAAARNPYDLWRAMKEEEKALRPGDLVEACDDGEQGGTEGGALSIFKYVGFEPAQWFVPEVRTGEPVPTGSSEALDSADTIERGVRVPL